MAYDITVQQDRYGRKIKIKGYIHKKYDIADTRHYQNRISFPLEHMSVDKTGQLCIVP